MKIKVIKKAEIESSKTLETIENKTEPKTATEMASIVSDWIDEFQKRRREKTESESEQFYS